MQVGILVSRPSFAFYDGKLLNGVTEKDRRPVNGIPPFRVHHVSGVEAPSDSGLSYWNGPECHVVLDYLRLLHSKGVPAQEIGVISPYLAQVDELTASLQDYKPQISTVDSFQGSEKSYILLTCSRSIAPRGLSPLPEFGPGNTPSSNGLGYGDGTFTAARSAAARVRPAGSRT